MFDPCTSRIIVFSFFLREEFKMQQIRFPFFFPVSITPFFCRMLIAYFYQYFIFIATKPKVSSKARIFGKRISIEIE